LVLSSPTLMMHGHMNLKTESEADHSHPYRKHLCAVVLNQAQWQLNLHIWVKQTNR